MALRFCIFLMAFLPLGTMAQTDSVEQVLVRGTVVDTARSGSLLFVIAVNKRTSRGIFGDTEGNFSILCQKGDTILVSARGFEIEEYRTKKTDPRDTITLKLYLKPIERNLAEVEVFPEREIEVIDEERKELGADLEALEPMALVDAIQSPITALYMRFSKIEKSKQKLAELEFEDRKNELLKELFRKYIRYDIIDLTNDEFDEFISYLHLSNEFIINASQYDLIMAIKLRYEQYRKIRRQPPASDN